MVENEDKNRNRKPSPHTGSKRTAFRGAVRIRQRIQVLNILSCVRTHAPIASYSSALPSEFGGSQRLRKKEFIVFKMYYSIVTMKR